MTPERLNPIPIRSVVDAFSLVGFSNWMKLGVYDEVIPTLSVDKLETTFLFKEMGAELGEAIVRFVNLSDWGVTLSRFIANDDGFRLHDDDGATVLNLD